MDISNGENVGVALFVQGCHLHCFNCFNPETWDFNGGKEWTEEIKNKFLELIDRPYIKRISILGGEPLAEENLDDVLEFVTEVNKRYNQNVFQNAEMLLDRGISNALYSQNEYTECNHDDCNRIRLSSPKKSIWIYTGYAWEDIFDETLESLMDCGVPGLSLADECEKTIGMSNVRKQIITLCDVLVDGRYIDSQRDISLPYRGSSNQRLIDIYQSLQKGEIVLWQT